MGQRNAQKNDNKFGRQCMNIGAAGSDIRGSAQPAADPGPAAPIKKKRPERRLFPCRLAEQAGFEPAEGY